MPSKFFNLDTDTNMTANSDYLISSQKAVKTALGTKADKEEVYTKEEVEKLIAALQSQMTDTIEIVDWTK